MNHRIQVFTAKVFEDVWESCSQGIEPDHVALLLILVACLLYVSKEDDHLVSL